jgi:hypothetical protein
MTGRETVDAMTLKLGAHTIQREIERKEQTAHKPVEESDH